MAEWLAYIVVESHNCKLNSMGGSKVEPLEGAGSVILYSAHLHLRMPHSVEATSILVSPLGD